MWLWQMFINFLLLLSFLQKNSKLKCRGWYLLQCCSFSSSWILFIFTWFDYICIFPTGIDYIGVTAVFEFLWTYFFWIYKVYSYISYVLSTCFKNNFKRFGVASQHLEFVSNELKIKFNFLGSWRMLQILGGMQPVDLFE